MSRTLVVAFEGNNSSFFHFFDQVTRIMGVETDSPYDVLGVNLNMSVDNVKKR